MGSYFGKTKLTTVVIFCLLAALLAFPTQAQWGTIVDPFDTNQSTVSSISQGVPAYGYQNGSDILGGERDIKTECTSGTCANQVYASANGSFLNHAQGPSAYGYSLIVWDGDDDAATINYTGLGGVNLTSGSADRIHIIGIEADHDGSDIIVTIYTNANYWSVGAITNIPEYEVPTDHQLIFGTDFTQGTGATGPANFSNVGAITLEINGRNVNSLDMSIDLIAAGGPTSIDLLSFTAAPVAKDILLAWETGSETSLQGFNLHRSDAVDGTYAQVNASVIPAEHPGQLMGASYTWLDQDVMPGGTYHYKLEALEDGGSSSFFGPASARALHVVYLPLVLRY